MAETTMEHTEEVAACAIELIQEMRAALKLAKGHRLSDAVTALAVFMRAYDELDHGLDGPFDDGTYRAIGEELNLAVHKLTLAPPSPTPETETP